MQTDLETFKMIVESLEKVVKGNKFHRSFTAYRIAGALEVLLSLNGGIVEGETFVYLEGGHKHLWGYLDMTWKENYPHMILRYAKEFLSKQTCVPGGDKSQLTTEK